MTGATPKKRGRPRKKPLPPEPSPPLTIKLYWKMPKSEEVRQIREHPNVPGDWSHERILRYFGISRHLKVVAETEGRSFVLQDFPVINS